MTAPTIRQIRSGFGDRLKTISGLRVFDTIPGNFSPPAAIVGMPRRVETETMQRGTDRYEVDIWVVVARQADAQSEKAVEQYLNATGATSVRAAIYADTTLGGVLGKGAMEEISAEPTNFVFGTSGQGKSEVHFIGLELRFKLLADGKD